MSQSALCRLCLNVSTNIKNLYNEDGQSNGVYEITVKYFHPMFLSVEHDNLNTVICYKCWRHISDFHNYQQSVFQAQRNLLDGEADIEFERSSEDLTKCDVSTIRKYDDDTNSLPDIELMEEFMHNDPMIQAYSLNNSLSHDNNGLSFKQVNDSRPQTTVEQIKQNSICHYNKHENDLSHQKYEQQSTTHSIQSKEENNFEQKYYIKPQIIVEKITNDFIHSKESPSAQQKDNLKSQISVERIRNNSIQSKEGHSLNQKDNATVENIAIYSLQDKTNCSLKQKEDFDSLITAEKIKDTTPSIGHRVRQKKYFKSQATMEKITKHSLQNKKNYSVNNFVESKPEKTVKNIRKHSPPKILSSNAIEIENLMKQNQKLSITKDDVINLDDDEEDNVDQRIAKKPRRSQVEMDSGISQWRDQLECVICKKKLQTFCTLQVHFRYEHPLAECHIVCCNRKLNSRFKIEEHARFHTDPNAFKCQKCGGRFSSEASLYTHKRKCQPKPGPKFFTKTPLEEIDNFIALYKPSLQCDLCQRTCTTFSSLKGHFRVEHDGKEFYVVCCQRKFNSRSVFKEHVWLHMDPNAFRCKLCQKLHSRFKCLQIHTERVHGIVLRADQVLTNSKLISNNKHND